MAKAKTAPTQEAPKRAPVPDGFKSRAGIDTPWYMIRETGCSLQGNYLGRYIRTTKGFGDESWIHQIALTEPSMDAQQVTRDGEVIRPETMLSPGTVVNVWETHQIRKELNGVTIGTEIFIAVEGKKILEGGHSFWQHMIATRD